ncbi:MAG: type IV pilin biogenesis protein [Deltaproteobacteria bacterium]|nr:type IV pilin biogenesis protein [Deltaproteobacteria bacterium]MBK8719104.1 type IV pilin biogenesis protein [Deltaproteobacteria bacterium]
MRAAVAMAVRAWGRLLVAGVVFVLGFALLGPTQARVRPYYVAQGSSFGAVKPRVLFVLDTSGSMGLKANADDDLCEWGECESTVGSETASRIATARASINAVVSSVGNAGSFALMTFEQRGPRVPPTVPAKCSPGAAEERRFTWVTQYEYFAGGTWQDIQRYPDHDGAWRICQGSEIRPYPYLRWDDLGVGAVISADDQTGDVPASPLIGTTSAEMTAWANSQRKVQWFPSFMGVRINLNDSTDPDSSITHATVGDYGNSDATTDSGVRGQDFYYWPYVDGFPGYAQWPVQASASGLNRAGISGENGSIESGWLYAPFYLDLSSSGISSDLWGPSSRSSANAQVAALTSPMIEGGVDTVGGTPWASTIGTISGSPIQTNAAFSHTTVASYLEFVTGVGSGDVCAPTSAVLLTDGDPSSGEGGATLYQRLAALRDTLSVKTYVVGFFLSSTTLNNMACAAAGACDGGTCSSPCDDSPAAEWDTCADPSNPSSACAFLAGDSAELTAILTGIVADAVDIDLQTGTGSTLNAFGLGADGEPGQGQILQTKLNAFTEFPGWRGHVARELCTDVDGLGDPQPWCVLPAPEFATEELEETFGPCPQSHVWDAGVCLQSTDWTDRRLYTLADDHRTLVPLADASGAATGAFKAVLEDQGLLTSGDHDAEADAFVAFVAGQNAPDGWKLPGVANSAPVVVRRVPTYRSTRIPEVAINDPHCAGRLYGDIDAGVLPDSLEDFARDANDEANVLPNPSPHNQYQEAVLIGDDMGVLHAFQLDSGNELWGFVPPELLPTLNQEVANGAAAMGQPDEISEHLYGVAGTVNHGFAYDEANTRWVHLGLFGFGVGGQEYYALDLSHMSPESAAGPFEVLWSTADAAVAASWDNLLGQTWARPALTYQLTNNELTEIPQARVVLGSGYVASETPATGEGRTLVFADAVTGEILDTAELPDIADPVFESNFGALVDPAVGTHCISRFWGEAQETYIADPAGRLFRWDLGMVAGTMPHEADSSAASSTWGGNAQEVFRFPACEGTGTECTVDDGNRGDPFIYPPAVSASDRLDDFTAIAAGSDDVQQNLFMVAMISGSPYDDTLDGGDEDNPFHSSIYLLIDDHRSGDQHLGFSIPAGAPKYAGSNATAGTTFPDNAGYLRLALSDIERTRIYTPYDGAGLVTETRAFSKLARPIRAPRIFVTGVADSTSGSPVVIEGIEVYNITFTIYEPSTGVCDSNFYEAATGTWHPDLGATYELTFRLTADTAAGFNFTTGTTSTDATFAGGFTPGLTLVSVAQVNTDECADGNCAPSPGSGGSMPCDNNSATPQAQTGGFAVPVSSAQINGFTAVE